MALAAWPFEYTHEHNCMQWTRHCYYTWRSLFTHSRCLVIFQFNVVLFSFFFWNFFVQFPRWSRNSSRSSSSVCMCAFTFALVYTVYHVIFSFLFAVCVSCSSLVGVLFCCCCPFILAVTTKFLPEGYMQAANAYDFYYSTRCPLFFFSRTVVLDAVATRYSFWSVKLNILFVLRR